MHLQHVSGQGRCKGHLLFYLVVVFNQVSCQPSVQETQFLSLISTWCVRNDNTDDLCLPISIEIGFLPAGRWMTQLSTLSWSQKLLIFFFFLNPVFGWILAKAMLENYFFQLLGLEVNLKSIEGNSNLIWTAMSMCELLPPSFPLWSGCPVSAKEHTSQLSSETQMPAPNLTLLEGVQGFCGKVKYLQTGCQMDAMLRECKFWEIFKVEGLLLFSLKC